MLLLKRFWAPLRSVSSLQGNVQKLAQTVKSPTANAKSVPAPRGHIQSVRAFLYHIGRNSEAIADKIKDWDTLFTSSSYDFKQMGLNPRQRKYVLLWTERYRRGMELLVIKNSGKRK